MNHNKFRPLDAKFIFEGLTDQAYKLGIEEALADIRVDGHMWQFQLKSPGYGVFPVPMSLDQLLLKVEDYLLFGKKKGGN